jgi:hypothetical protein
MFLLHFQRLGKSISAYARPSRDLKRRILPPGSPAWLVDHQMGPGMDSATEAEQPHAVAKGQVCGIEPHFQLCTICVGRIKPIRSRIKVGLISRSLGK